MATIELSDGLRVALTDLIAHETEIQKVAGDLSARVSGHPATHRLFAEIHQTSGDHLTAIRDRLGVPDNGAVMDGEPRRTDQTGFAERHPVSDSLCAVYSLLSGAVIRYSAMQSIATRLLDSWAVAEKGTTGHIARGHTQEYVAIMGRIMDIVHDVVIWELENDGLECRCTCPSCNFGVCLCAVTGRGVLAAAFTAARPRGAESGVEVLRPRLGSAAERAGFVLGDILTAVDGVDIDAPPVLQGAISDHETGAIEFTVARDGKQIALTSEAT